MLTRLSFAAFVTVAVLNCDIAEARRGGFLSALIRGGTHAAVSSSTHTSSSTTSPSAVKVYGADTLTVAQLEQCVASAVELDRNSETLDARSQGIEKEKAAIESAQSDLSLDKARVNTRSQASVDAFNRKLGALNARIDSFNASVRASKEFESAHNLKVASYNVVCAKRYFVDDMNAVKQKLGLKE